jgi:hypothetical protein
MRIAKIRAETLNEFADRLVHAHIADHPGAHTRDQAPGSWTAALSPDSGYLPYLRLLAERAQRHQPTAGLPFSGAFALELEGCDSLSPVYSSIPIMMHMSEMVRQWT